LYADLFAKHPQGWAEGANSTKTKAPQTPFRVMGRPFEQPSPEVCSITG